MKTPFLFTAILASFSLLSASADTLQVDQAKSWIRCDCKATGHSFQAHLSKFKAGIEGTKSPLAATKTTLTWDFADLSTKDKKRDKEMLEWLEYAKHASGKFEMTKYTPGNAGQGTAEGKLTIHGVAKTINFPVRSKVDKGVINLDGEVTINYKDHGLPVIRMLIMTVKPEIKINFHLEGTAK